MNSKIYHYLGFEFEHIVRQGMKHTYIQIQKSGQIILKSPPISKKKAFQTIEKQSKWIHKQLEKMKNQPTNEALKPGHFLYLGKSYKANIIKTQEANNTLSFQSFSFQFHTHQKNYQTSLQQALDEFYWQKAEEKILPLFHFWIDEMDLVPNNIILKKQRRRWGSCTSKGNILINYQCIKLPLPCIELIVVHELAHLKIPNHSKHFWALVEKFIPDYRERQKELKEFSLRFEKAFD